MKKIIVFIAALFIGGSVFSQGIDFQHVSFDEALAKAKKENKMVFMDCYTTWCGPCKALAKNIFPQKEVGDYFNANFICIKMDMEKGEGPALLKKYEIKGFPTLLYMDATGKVLSTRVGGTDAAGLIADGKTAGDPTERLEYVQKKYNDGDRSKEIVTKYISLLQKNYMREEMAKVGAEYLKKLSKEDLLQPDNFKAFCAVGTSFESENFQYIFKNKEKFNSVVGEEAVDQLVMYTYYSYLPKLSEGNDFEKLKRNIAAFDKLYADPRNEMFYNQLYEGFYLSNKQFDKWFEAKSETLNKTKLDNKEMYGKLLMRYASEIASNPAFADAPNAYDKAFTWVNTAVELNANVENVNLCKALLYQKKGDKENAVNSLKKFEQKNPSLSERMDRYYKSVKVQIEKM